MIGYVNSIQSFGAADGPGVRFITFLQGCNLRCACCHNPETWSLGGNAKLASDIVNQAKRYKEYFGAQGGITISGGEPLLQPEFCHEIFELCKKEGINTCIDTSGSILNLQVKNLLKVTDLVLLDVKFTTKEKYKLYTGGEYSEVLEFLQYLSSQNIPAWIRQVVIPGLNTDKANFKELNKLRADNKNIKRVELLPFKKLCAEKYKSMGIKFSLENTPEPTQQEMKNYMEQLEGCVEN